jgi:uncharacterized protein YqhQ
MQDLRTIGAMGAAALGGHLIRAGGPARAAGTAALRREAAVAVLSMAPAVMALRSGEVAAYHGVEHKAIAGYEEGEDAASADKEHDRCGSNLVAPMLVSTVAGNALARALLGATGPIASAAVTVASAAVAVEVFGWSERNRETALARALKRPGNEMQRLFATREPSEAQLEVGRAALAAILQAELGRDGAGSFAA